MSRIWTVLALAASAAACGSRTGAPSPTAGPGVQSVTLTRAGVASGEMEIRSETSVSETNVAQAEPAAIWPLMSRVFAALEIETTTVDPTSMIIGNRGYRARPIEDQPLSRYIECGRDFAGPYADQYQVTLTVMVQLRPNPEGGTIVSTVVDGNARARSVSGGPIHCTSKRVLERRIMEMIGIGIAGG